MSISDKLTTIAENVQKVYEAGKAAGGCDEFWDSFQDYGNRKSYLSAFVNTNFKILKSKYGFENVVGTNSMFQGAKSEEIEFYNDFKMNTANYMFASCVNLKRIKGLIALGYGPVTYAFYACAKLQEIEEVDFSKITSGYSETPFSGCAALEEIRFRGTIPYKISFQWCTKLSHESLMSIINALKDYSEDTSGTTYTLTIGSTNIAKLTSEEQKIAKDKGWVIA